MLLAIDVGNTTTVVGIYEEKILVKDWRIHTPGNITKDEFSILASVIFSKHKIEIKQINQTIISCVVPAMIPILDSFCGEQLGHSPHWVNAKSHRYMPIFINNPNELGADRIVNSVAAYAIYMKSLIVVDFGTATTFDAISSEGEYLGGAISPGIMISSEALFDRTSKLPHVDISTPPEFALGKDTITSMQSGIIFGYAGLVDAMVKRLSREMEDSPTIISTGGLASLMQGVSSTIEKIEPSLTLEGLRIIATRF